MTTITLNAPFAAQETILRDRSRFRVLVTGRRWGKTEVLKIICAERMKRGQRIWFCSPTNKNNKRVWPQFKAMFKAVSGTYVNNSDHIIELPNGGYIEFVSLHEPDNLRGEGLNLIVVDEAAFVGETVWDEVLRPMLVTDQGHAIFASSPNGKNWFHNLYLRGLDPQEAQWASYHHTSYDSPAVPSSEIDDIKRNTPERVFQQEYMAEFLEDGGAVFRNLKACIVVEPSRQGRVVIGADWARHHDYTVLTAIDADTRHVLEIDRFNQIDWTLQRGRLEAMYQRWNADMVWAETNSIGEPNIEELRKSGLNVKGFTTTPSSKPGLINSLALAFEQEDIGIPDNPTLLGELQAYTVERLPGGTFRYNAPAGMHDDMVISLALAWHGISQGTLRVESAPSALSNFRG